MKLRHTIFNSIGLGVASFVGYSCFGTVLLIFFTHVGLRHPGRYIFQIFYDSVIIFGVGGSALINLASGRLKSSPTLVMVVVYFLSIFLFPLGIWGIVELLGNSNKKYRHRERIDRYVASPKKNAASGNLARVRWLAALSWFIPSAGIILVAAAGSMHHEALIQPVISVSVVGVLLSLIFGLYALFNVSEYGKPGILLPAVIGTVVSSFLVLYIVASLAFGYVEDRSGPANAHLPAGQDTTAPAHQP